MAFISPNVMDSNGEAANLVDAVDDVARALHRIADSQERAQLWRERQSGRDEAI